MWQSLLSSWGADFVALFSNSINIACMVCLLIGLILCFIECFVPGFGVFGITGLSFIVISLVVILATGGTWRQFVYIIGIMFLVFVVILIITIRSARFGFISKSPLVQNETALPKNYSNENNLKHLMDKVGTTQTVCKPSGKAIIEGETYQVVTDGEYIAKNSEVYVADVDGNTITVKKR